METAKDWFITALIAIFFVIPITAVAVILVWYCFVALFFGWR